MMWFKNFCFNFLLSVLTFRQCESLNTLLIVSFFGKSHYFVFESIAKELTARGHNVTVIVNFPIPYSDQFRVINIAENDRKTRNNTEIMSIGLYGGTRMDNYRRPLANAQFCYFQCERLTSNELQNFIKENNTFDVVIAEVFNTNCFFGLAKKYDAPIVGVSSTDILPWMYQWFGSPENPSYIPVLFMDYADKMSFFQRMENTLMLLYSKIVHRFFIANPGNEYSKKHLGIDLYEGGDILYNISILLANRHYTFQTPKPLSPNVIEVGGIHLTTPTKLPEPLEDIVERSPHGTIFMSMGSTLKGSTFPEEQRKMFLKVFSNIKQTVIWKWENETMEGLPENVKIEKWVPQLDVLCNPNVKVFITHGGLLGTQEAVYCGVPMLILPLFADQHSNAAALENTKATISLKLRSITAETLLEALEKLLSNEFSKNAKLLSDRFRDRPMSPMDTAIYWIEYVARHKGAPFMRPAITDMPFYQYLLLDVAGFLIVAVILFMYIIFIILRKIVLAIMLLNRFKSKIKIN